MTHEELAARIGRPYVERAPPVATLGEARVYRREEEPFLERRGDAPQGSGRAWEQEMGDG